MTAMVSRKRLLLTVCILVLAAVGLYGLVPQFNGVHGSFAALQDATPLIVAAAAGCSLLAVVFAALLYTVLSIKRLVFGQTLLVQLAGLCINRVLPAGIGGLGLNFLYLRSRRHTTVQATAIVTLNNVIGLIGHLLIAGGVLVVSSFTATTFDGVHVSGITVAVALAALLVIATGLWLYGRARPALRRRFGKQIGALLKFYRQRPTRLIAGVGISMLLTASNVCAFWLCCSALGISLNVLQVFAIFTLGIAVATATPTPGGVGGAEAALTAGLVTQNVSLSLALAAALLYRLVSFWAGLVLGAIATPFVIGRGLLR